MTNNIALEIQSISTSMASRNGYSVVLKEIGGSRKLQIIVGSNEAQSLAIALEKIITSRPLTHHFIQNVLQAFEIQLKYVQIYKYEEGVYFAHAVFEDNFGNNKHIDTRPSDAICLALKMEKPIFAFEEIFDEATQTYLNLTDEKSDDKSMESKPISELKKMLKDAVQQENYEMAEKIQAILNKR